MSLWWKVMVDLVDHPRVIDLQTRFPKLAGDAMSLWLMAGSRIKQQEIEPRLALPLLKRAWPIRTERAADALVAVGLWSRTEDGEYEFGNWEKHNDPACLAREKADRQREKAAQRQRDCRARKRDGVTPGHGVTVTPRHAVTVTTGHAPVTPLEREQRESRERTAAAAAEDERDTPRWAQAIAAFERAHERVFGHEAGAGADGQSHQRGTRLLKWALKTRPADPLGLIEATAAVALRSMDDRVRNRWAAFVATPGQWLESTRESEADRIRREAHERADAQARAAGIDL